MTRQHIIGAVIRFVPQFCRRDCHDQDYRLSSLSFGVGLRAAEQPSGWTGQSERCGFKASFERRPLRRQCGLGRSEGRSTATLAESKAPAPSGTSGSPSTRPVRFICANWCCACTGTAKPIPASRSRSATSLAPASSMKMFPADIGPEISIVVFLADHGAGSRHELLLRNAVRQRRADHAKQ